MKTNYQTKKLGEICDFQGGSQPPKSQFSYEPKDGYVRFLQIRDFGNDKNITYIPESKKNRYCFDGDILLGRYGASVGKILINKKGAYNVAVMKTIPNLDILDKRYFYFYLISDEFQKKLSKVAARSAQAGFSKEDIYNFPVITPPLSDQQRIVKILDEAFEKIEKVKKDAEKNLQNSKEIFESYLQNIFTNKNNDWKENRFGEIINLLTDYHANGSYQILKANVELKNTEDYAWMVRSTDFENNFQKDKRYITKKSYDFLKKSKIFGNEIIICKIGNAGKVYLMPKIDRPCSLAMNSFLIRLNESKCLSEYVYQYLNSKNGREQIESRILGTTTKTITKDNVRSIVIPYPSLKEQNIIVEKINALSEGTKKLESICKQKLTDLEELKKSILSKAFSGEL